MMHLSYRYAVSTLCGVTASLLLLLVMQHLVSNVGLSLGPQKPVRLLPYVHVAKAEVVQTVHDEPQRPPAPEPQPPAFQPREDFTTDVTSGVIVPPADPGVVSDGPSVRSPMIDGEPMVVVAVQPQYPSRAVTRGIEGNCVVEYTITALGTVENPSIVSCTSSLFEHTSLDAARRFKYRPRVIDGEALPVYGHRNRFVYSLED